MTPQIGGGEWKIGGEERTGEKRNKTGEERKRTIVGLAWMDEESLLARAKARKRRLRGLC